VAGVNWQYRAESAESILRAANASIDRVRKVHEPIDAVMFAGGRQHPRKVCTGCGTDDGNWQIWPCPTIRAVDQKD
jgi:hypothetical protein